MKTHEMRLHREPFETIKEGKKTIESRLNDEKRQKIEIGDHLIFESREDPNQRIETEVVALHREDSFQELFAKLDCRKLGGMTADDLLSQIQEFYTQEDQNKYGVVGIEFKTVGNKNQ